MDFLREGILPQLTQHAHLLRLQTELPDASFVVERFTGREAVNELFRFELHCLADNALVDPGALLGREATLRLLQADESLRNWHGYVTEAMSLGSDGGLARYRLAIEPGLAFCAIRHDCFQFQDKDVLGVAEEIFADYPTIAWRSEVTQRLRVHSRITQYRESDLAFLVRVLSHEGLSFRFEHDQAALAGDDSVHARHTLVIFDREADAPTSLQPVVRFHRNDAPEHDDAVSMLQEIRETQPNRVSLSSWDYRKLTATAATIGSAVHMGEVPPMEIHHGGSAYRFEDEEAARLRNELMLAAFESAHHRFAGEGGVRQMAEGTTFTLTEHDELAGDDARMYLLSVEHEATNNLTTGVAELDGDAAPASGSYRSRFVAQRAGAAVVPMPIPQPRAELQTALVTGHADAPLTTDREHRIKIQYPWQRGKAPNPGGLTDTASVDADGNAPGDARSGTWVRVAEWLAGPDWGSHFLPRVGTEVLVDFIDGDIDRPIVIGQCYNGADLPPFSAGVDSSANHPGTISGWHSHNFGTGGNQWLVDDAPGQLRTRLATSESNAQLGLGHLVDQAVGSAHRGSWRGTGFELRTDGWLAVRAGEGILISASARHNAAGTQMDVAEAVGQLRAAEHTAQMLSEAASMQGAAGLEANARQTGFIDAIDPAADGRFSGSVGGQAARKAQTGSRQAGEPTERFARPFILTEGPDDIGLSSPASGLLFAAGNLHATVQQDLHSASAHTFAACVGASASWFAHSGGIKSICAAGSQSIQANTDEMEILADDSVVITSSSDEIHILARDTIVLAAGQSSITIKGGDITFACPGTFSVKGSGNAFQGPEQASPSIDPLPDTRARLYDEAFIVKDKETGELLKNYPYRIRRADGQYEEGLTDELGRTHTVTTADAEELVLELPEH